MATDLTQDELNMQAELVWDCIQIAKKGWLVVCDSGEHYHLQRAPLSDPAELPYLIYGALAQTTTHPWELRGQPLREALDRARRALSKLPPEG